MVGLVGGFRSRRVMARVEARGEMPHWGSAAGGVEDGRGVLYGTIANITVTKGVFFFGVFFLGDPSPIHMATLPEQTSYFFCVFCELLVFAGCSCGNVGLAARHQDEERETQRRRPIHPSSMSQPSHMAAAPAASAAPVLTYYGRSRHPWMMG